MRVCLCQIVEVNKDSLVKETDISSGISGMTNVLSAASAEGDGDGDEAGECASAQYLAPDTTHHQCALLRTKKLREDFV